MSYLSRTNSFVSVLNADTYLVGGAVRDYLLSRRIKDADYVVRMGADDLRKALRKTGADVGPLALRSGKVIGYRAAKPGIGAVEIALPRVEEKVLRKFSDVGNERHAVNIVVDPSIPLADDAARRDFTINALYSPVNGTEGGIDINGMKIIDPLGGLDDLTSKLVRTTHPDSFKEDPLRILRALRFVAVLDPDGDGFDLAPNTYREMRRYSQSVTGLTGKGVSGTALEELSKILMGRHVAKSLRLARDTGVLGTLLPELAPMLGFEQNNVNHDMTTDEHTFTALDWAAAAGLNLRTRFALLFHDAGKPESSWLGDDGYLHFYEPSDDVWKALGERRLPVAEPGSKPKDHAVISAKLAKKALRRLNADSKLIRDVPRIIEAHMVPLTAKVKPTKVRKWRVDFGDDLLADLLKHRLADCFGKSVVSYEALSAIYRMEQIREDAVAKEVPASAKDLKDAGLIDGNDLIEMGVPGPKIGEILGKLLHEVVSDPDKRMDRDWLLGRAKKLAHV